MALLGYYIPGLLDDYQSIAEWFSRIYGGQSFQTLYNGTLSSISLAVSASAGFTYAEVSIYAGDENQHPTGSALSTGEFSSLDINPSDWYDLVWTDVTMSSVALTTSTWYVLVVKAYGTSDWPHYLRAWGKSTSGITGKPMYSADGVSWTDNTFIGDWAFKVEGTISGGGGSEPSKAINPTPANSDTEVDFSEFQLSWEDGGDADTYNVYIGDTGALSIVSGGQAETTYTTSLATIEALIGASPIEQKIYWRVDASNDEGTTTGDEWNFDPRPGKATVPSPATAATGTNLTPALSWTAGAGADSYTLYVGGVEQTSGIEDTEYTDYADWFDYATEYTWRLDSVNQFGTTTGDDWTFTTLTYDPPISSWVNLAGKTLGPLTGGVEGTDYRWLGTNNMNTVKYIVAAAKDAIHYAEI